MPWLLEWTALGGFICGALVGGAARYGRLCSMSAIEDALVGRDWRAAKAWGLALAVAIVATQVAMALNLVDVSRAHHAAIAWHLPGTLLGGLLFGLGMALVGTCSFGLLVRAGGGDLRAAVSAIVVGISAYVITAGVLAPVREVFLGLGIIHLQRLGGATLPAMAEAKFGPAGAAVTWLAVAAALALLAALDPRLRRRPRLLLAAAIVGLAIAVGWIFTGQAVERLVLDRPESLSFVAPVGRLLLQMMMQPFRNVGFGVGAVAGAIVAAFVVTAWRRELRWEAFDDPTEMRRHLTGAMCMGIGGVLAQGCTIGQGLSAGSLLAISMPVFLAAVLIGARLGLAYLIEGQALWRLGKSSR